MSVHTTLKKALEARESQNLLRGLQTVDQLHDFSSNDYLGISSNPEVLRLLDEAYQVERNRAIGSGGSRLLAGNMSLHEQLEAFLAEVHQGESALLFNSGYVANLGFFGAVPQRGDTILYDTLIHASIKDGMRLSNAKRYSFAHNDLDSLEKRLQKGEGQVFVVVESVYSMDGDFAPLREMVALCEQYNAHLIVDEAHSTGLWGKNGAGLCCEWGIQDRVYARIHTFGKGIGAHGACIVGSKTLREYLINFSRPFIYTTSQPTHALLAIRTSYEYIANQPSLRKILFHKVDLFKKEVGESSVISDSPIQVIFFPGNEKIRSVAKSLQDRGFDVRPVMSPTVKAGSERLRVCLHVHNSDGDIVALATALKGLRGEI